MGFLVHPRGNQEKTPETLWLSRGNRVPHFKFRLTL